MSARGHLDSIGGDVDLTELPRPSRVVFFEEVVHGTAKRIGHTFPVNIRLVVRLLRRVRQRLFYR